MRLTLYNTQTRKKEPFEPLDASRVGMYVCGPTVYDLAHIGNARPIIVFDVLYRLLRNIYGVDCVKYVRNITDVDDKINAAAKESGEPISAITARTTQAFHDDIAELNALPPDVEPRATDHIAEMIEIIGTLIDKEHAYFKDGHVLFHVPSNPNYGKLSHRDREEMVAGARVEVAPYKQDPADFVLWKPSSDDLPGWDSPWGRGRPGWHIECSAMSRKHLGLTVDIHGGGADLIFPHHENEVAQSECACPGHDFVRHWVHNGFLSVNGEKMSKSLGNFITIRQALEGAPGEVLRLMMLSTHYRHPLDWTEEGLRQARTRLDRLYRVLQKTAGATNAQKTDNSVESDPFLAALHDDLNTPLALSVLERQADDLSKMNASESAVYRSNLLANANTLGILQKEPEAWFKGGEAESDVGHIEAQISLRLEARKAKDFAAADNIRDALAENGIILEDRPDGSTDWRRAG
ncbi:MAG: Cysteine--tRNA ligase [Alphaproteobacteria bacterium MarineAlpha10_Bin1]|nr:MAG: Cysteine--tRNA ligase [Alphaproteobacteria bacterium MarineAlpha10_Bin1]